jgi:DNA adenine methylase
MKTVLKYPGSKGSMAAHIISKMPRHKTYCEPFGGAAAVLLAKQPSEVEWYNDTFGEVLNLFELLRVGGEQLHSLREQVELTAFSRAELELARKPLDSTCKVEQVRRFLVRSWLSYGGSLSNHRTGFRTSKSDTKRLLTWNQLGDRLDAAASRFKDVYIERLDAIKLMMVLDGSETLFYVDPPYVEETLNFREVQVYHQPFLLHHHVDLLCCLRNLKGKVILSGYDHPTYNDLLKGWRRETVKHMTQSHSFKDEVLWFNFEEEIVA